MRLLLGGTVVRSDEEAEGVRMDSVYGFGHLGSGWRSNVSLALSPPLSHTHTRSLSCSLSLSLSLFLSLSLVSEGSKRLLRILPHAGRSTSAPPAGGRTPMFDHWSTCLTTRPHARGPGM